MKKIEAVVRPYKLDDVKDALIKEGLLGMTVSEVRGFGRQKGQREMYRGSEYVVDLVPKIKIEVVVDNHDEERAMKIILQAARTGQIGDGKVFVSDLTEVVRIRTGETGPSAL